MIRWKSLSLATAISLLSFAVAAFPAAAGAPEGQVAPITAASEPGAQLYAEHCAQCHDHPSDRIPPRVFLRIQKTPEQVMRALTSGIMQSQAAGLTRDQIGQLAAFITGRQLGAATDTNPQANLCKNPPREIRFDRANWPSWGHDFANSRYQPDPGFTAAEVPKLKVKWVFALPRNGADGQPTIYGDRLFVTSRAGWIFSLDARTGCTYWSLDTEGGVRTAINIDQLPPPAPAKYAAYFATENGWLHAVDAETGKAIWTLRVEDHPVTRITGSPTLYKHRLYVPLSSLEEIAVDDPSYTCCTFRGGVAAVDALTGKLLWKAYTLAEPKKLGVAASGLPMYGPAGAAVFSAPTIDAKRNLIYVGTGNSYTQVSADTVDAIVAFDLDSGARRWASQVTPNDNDCPVGIERANCTHIGHDWDFAAPPILQRLTGGKDILVDGSKAEIAYGFDPDHDGRILWRTDIGKGNPGAALWGLAADKTSLYMGSADNIRPEPEMEMGGLSALDIATGRILWHTPAPPPVCAWGSAVRDLGSSGIAGIRGAVNCTSAQPGALVLIPGAVFSGSIDGHMRAYSTKDGKVIWDFDTAAHPWDAVNAAKAAGGSINYGAQAIAAGTVFVVSGAGGVHRAGNALMAFTIDGK